MAFTEFYCNAATGSNLYAGSTEGAPLVTYASGSWNGTTGVFTVPSGNPITDGVAVGDFASVYPDAATVTPFVARITARDATTITVSLTVKSGTKPASGMNGTTLVVGGVWKGPNGSDVFPFTITVLGTLKNADGHYARINFKNNASYLPSVSVNIVSQGTLRVQGYNASPGDGGKALIDGGANVIAGQLVSWGGTHGAFVDFELKSSATSGTCRGFVSSGVQRFVVERVVTHGFRGSGMHLSGSGWQISAVECEVYDCSKANGEHAFYVADSPVGVLRCISHHNSGSAVAGFYSHPALQVYFIDCISYANGAAGFYVGGGLMKNCDSYSNGGAGIFQHYDKPTRIENCNVVKNGGYGIQVPTEAGSIGTQRIVNCGFGSGTQANVSGATSLGPGVEIEGSVTYPANVTPWVDPANGDFRVNLAAACGTGRGAFTQTAPSYAGTVAYPDIGAAQHAELTAAQIAAAMWSDVTSPVRETTA